MEKYKFSWKDLSLNDFKTYFFSLFKAFIPKKKIGSLDDIEEFIQSKSAWVSQVTLYGYLKTRMGTRYVLHFENDEFMKSVNLAKWNIYVVAISDLTFYVYSFLIHQKNLKQNDAEKIFSNIIEDEFRNGLKNEVGDNAKKEFNKKSQNINALLYWKFRFCKKTNDSKCVFFSKRYNNI